MSLTEWAIGKRHYTVRNYRIRSVPPELMGLSFLRTANGDDRRLVDRLISFVSDTDVTVLVGVDSRNPEPLEWMEIGQADGFQDVGLKLITDDPSFNFYSKRFPAGRVSLGPNLNGRKDSGRGNYIVVFEQELLETDMVGEATC